MNYNLKNELEIFYFEHVWEKVTLGAILSLWSQNYKDNIAIKDGNKKLTYNELNITSKRLANGFIKMGLKKGDKILIQLPNCLEFVVTSFALFKIGVIPVMALSPYRNKEISGILEKSEARAYIIKDKYLGFDYRVMARSVIKEVNRKVDVIVLGECEEFLSLSELLKEEEEINEATIDNIDCREIGLILLSGGTTGIPKLIPRRHTDYIYVAKETAKGCNLNASSIYLAALPMAHNFPLCCPGILGTLSVGGKVVLCRNTTPDEIVPMISEEKVTVTALVPAMASMCIEFLNYENTYNLSSLKVLQVGGSVLEPSLAKEIEESFKCKLQQVFGIAEGLICHTSLDDDDYIRYYTQGKPISKYDEVLIVDVNENEVSDEEYGELIVRGPYTIYGYYNNKEMNSKCMTEECFFRTGDKARRLKDGNYQVVGRIKEMINKAGEKILPSELEDLLLQHENINDVQVIGVPYNYLGEKICVFIIDNGNRLTLKEVRAYLIDNGVASFKLPDEVRYINKWPLTSIGKINRKSLVKLSLNKDQ